MGQLNRRVNKARDCPGFPRNWVLRALSLCYLNPANATISGGVPKAWEEMRSFARNIERMTILAEF